MSGCSACPICGDIYYDPPQGDGPGCDCATATIQPPTPEQSDAAMRDGHYYVWLPGAEYDDLTARLSRLERIEAAAREWRAAEDELHVYPVQVFEQGDHHLDPPISTVLERQYHAKQAFWSALAEPVDDAGSGEEG